MNYCGEFFCSNNGVKQNRDSVSLQVRATIFAINNTKLSETGYKCVLNHDAKNNEIRLFRIYAPLMITKLLSP